MVTRVPTKKSMQRAMGVSAIAMAAAVTLVAPTAASAAPRGFARCPANHFCLFSEKNGEGIMGAYQVGTTDTALQVMPNGARSGANNMDKLVSCFPKVNYGWDDQYDLGHGMNGPTVIPDFFRYPVRSARY